MVKEYAASVRNACRAARLPRSCYYATAPEHDVIALIEQYVRDDPHEGLDEMRAACKAHIPRGLPRQ